MLNYSMLVALAKQSAKSAGLDYSEVRRAHRASWKWLDVNGGWQTATLGSWKLTGWDVTCSCGWESRTGGAIRARVQEDHAQHVWDVILETGR